MKNTLCVAVLSLCCTLLFIQCSKSDQDKMFHANFYTTKQTGKMYLYIDGVNKGELSWFTEMSPCGDISGDGTHTPLTLELKSGEYSVIGKDDQGSIISRSMMRISSKRMEVWGTGPGGLRLAGNGDCVSVGLSE